MKTIKKTEDRLELKKHIAAIHCHGKITLLQRKIANALLFHAYHNLMTKEDHVIQISELSKLIGYDSNDHKKVKDALLKLLSTVIEWNVIDELSDDSETWNASSMIADVSIKGSICRYSYSNKMRNLLYHPVRYGKIDLNLQTQFQSSYGLTLYENCNRYQSIGNTPWFDLETFKKLMGVEGGLYKIFRDLNNRVIKKAVEEVNKYTPMFVEPEFRKLNRQVVSIRFTIKPKKQKELHFEQDQKSDLEEKLSKQFGFSSSQIGEALKEFDETYIENKINIICKSEPYRNGTIRNLARYLQAALKEDYQETLSSQKQKKLVVYNKDSKTIEKLELERERFKQQYLEKLFSDLSEEEKNQILHQFQLRIKRTVYASLFLKNGINNILIKEKFYTFFEEMMNISNIQPIGEYNNTKEEA